MPDLKQSLLDQDLGYLRIIAERWGLLLDAPDTKSAIASIVPRLLDDSLIVEVVESLPDQALQALYTLYKNEGKVPWSFFTRTYGQVREMGPGRRDRERPDRQPESAVEILWYRALVGRAFFDAPNGTEEFAYIPADLYKQIPNSLFSKIIDQEEKGKTILGRTATTVEYKSSTLVTDRILDHACTLLAGLRIGESIESFQPYSLEFVHAIIGSCGILDHEGYPIPDAARNFLELPRGEALILLAQTWINSQVINDLHMVPDLQPEGEWENDPLETRRFFLGHLSALPSDKWWSLSAFVADIRQRYPDFQRPAGDYDSWFIRDSETDEYLRGFKHWDDVDGKLIRYLITGPCYWLGIVDVGAKEDGSPESAFKLSKWAETLVGFESQLELSEEKDRINVRSDGRVSVSRLVPREVRYQVARFCVWEDETQYEYRYRLSPSSLTRALNSGLKVSHLISLLHHNAEMIPPNIMSALGRWDEHGSEVRIQTAAILRLGSPQILDALRKSRATRFLGDPLGPTTIIVKNGAEEKVLAALSEMGFFGEIVEDI